MAPIDQQCPYGCYRCDASEYCNKPWIWRYGLFMLYLWQLEDQCIDQACSHKRSYQRKQTMQPGLLSLRDLYRVPAAIQSNKTGLPILDFGFVVTCLSSSRTQVNIRKCRGCYL